MGIKSSAADLCKQFGPRSGPTRSKLFDSLIVFLKELKKVHFEKSQQMTKQEGTGALDRSPESLT